MPIDVDSSATHSRPTSVFAYVSASTLSANDVTPLPLPTSSTQSLAQQPHARSWFMEFILGGAATMSAALFTNPLETVKTRMQVQGELERSSRSASKVYRNAFHAFYLIGRNEGIRGLQGGLVPACLYQLMMNGARLGAYEPFKQLYTANGTKPHLLKNAAAGSTSGCIGALLGSPFFLIKVRLQVQNYSAVSNPHVSVGYQHAYKGALSGLLLIARTEGLRGLYRGASAAMLRVSIGSGIQLSTYDASKAFVQSIRDPLLSNNVSTNFAASMVSGLLVTFAMNPFDVVSTRLYNQPASMAGTRPRYTGVTDCISKIARAEGLAGFYKGFLPHYLRLGPHSILTFVFWEELKKRF